MSSDHNPNLAQTSLPRDLAKADLFLQHTPLTLQDAQEWMNSLSPMDLYTLRRATLRVHRHCVGPYGQGDPTVAELDVIIASVGPIAAENMLRRAVDEKLGEYDRGRHGHSLADDSDFRRKT